MRTWAIERSLVPLATMTGHTRAVTCVAAWAGPADPAGGDGGGGGGRAATGSEDRTVRVWALGAGVEEWVLSGHEGEVTAVVVAAAAGGGGALISASQDGTVRSWSLQTWACTRRVEVGPRLRAQGLAVSGARLLCAVHGAAGSAAAARCVLQARRLDTLEEEHSVPVRGGAPGPIQSVLVDGGEAWAFTSGGATDSDPNWVMAWGWEPRPARVSWAGRLQGLLSWMG